MLEVCLHMYRPFSTVAFGRTFLIAGLVFCSAKPALADDPIDHDISDVTEAINAGGPLVDLLVARARLWLTNDSPQQALSDILMAHALEPDNEWVSVVHAEILDALMDPEQALAVLARTRSTFLSEMLKGRLHEDAEHFELALRAYLAAGVFSMTSDLLLAQGRCLRHLDRISEAAFVYRSHLADVGGATLVRRALIETLVDLARYQDALAEIARARLDAPEPVRWDLREADVLDRIGRQNDAEQLRQQVVDRLSARIYQRPTAARWLLHAQTLAELGRLDQARASARRALTLAPRYAPALALAERLGL